MTDRTNDRFIDAKEAKARFSDALGKVAKEKRRVIIRKRKKPVAALIPIEDLHVLQALEEEIDLRDAHAALEKWERGGRKSSRPLAEVAKDFGVKI